MKTPAFPTIVLFLSGVIGLACAAQSARAQQSKPSWLSPPRIKPTSILGKSYKTLLARYGQPTKIYVLTDSPPDKSSLPSGVPLFPLGSASPHERPVLPHLTGRHKNMIWLYKSAASEASYLVNASGQVEYTCAAETDSSREVSGLSFEASPLSEGALGDDMRKVLSHNGMPAEVRHPTTSLTELVYRFEENPRLHGSVFSTAFTIRNNRVVRLYSYLNATRPASAPLAPNICLLDETP